MWIHCQVEEEPNAFCNVLENGAGNSTKAKKNIGTYLCSRQSAK